MPKQNRTSVDCTGYVDIQGTELHFSLGSERRSRNSLHRVCDALRRESDVEEVSLLNSATIVVRISHYFTEILWYLVRELTSLVERTLSEDHRLARRDRRAMQFA